MRWWLLTALMWFDTLWRWNQGGSWFVVRLKTSVKFHRGKVKPLPEERHQHILVDEYITLSEEKTRQKYPTKLRRVVVYDGEHDRTIELITNQFSWTANTISELYKARWDIEIFFKDLKQLLKIKSFLGTSANAVLIQIPAALITMLILKYLKACASYPWCLSNMVAFLRLNLFGRQANVMGPNICRQAYLIGGIEFGSVKKSVLNR